MSDANVDVVRRVEEAWNANDLDALDELFAPTFVAHTPGSDQGPPGLEGAKQAHTGTSSAFPDKRCALEDIFGEGDSVVARCRFTGTNTGGLPWFGISANDRPVDLEWITIYRVENGKVAETWAQMEVPKLMQQLGAMPEM